jgi:hypothetical protein
MILSQAYSQHTRTAFQGRISTSLGRSFPRYCLHSTIPIPSNCLSTSHFSLRPSSTQNLHPRVNPQQMTTSWKKTTGPQRYQTIIPVYGPTQWDALISRLVPREKDICPSLALLRAVVLPSLQDSLKFIGLESALRALRTLLCPNLSRGWPWRRCSGQLLRVDGASSKTADHIVVFHPNCLEESAGAFDGAAISPIDFSVFDKGEPQDSSEVSNELAIAAASALGYIISTEGGSPLLKHCRNSYISVKRIVHQLQDTTSGTKRSHSLSLFSLSSAR